MALVVPPPTNIPNALSPTTEAVERDAEDREITPPVTAENATAATSDATTNNHEVNYRKDKSKKHKDKQLAEDEHKHPFIEPEVVVDIEHDEDEFIHIEEHVTSYIPPVSLEVPVGLSPEALIIQLIEKKQHILAQSDIDSDERGRLAEINHTIRLSLLELFHLKELDEVKTIAANLPKHSQIIKDTETDNSLPIALSDLFTFTAEDELGVTPISAKTKLAGAVIGQFYEDNIEPQLNAKIDRNE